MDEAGTHIRDKDRIVKRCVEFYKELYSSRRASADQASHGDQTTASTIVQSSMLPWEVEVSINRLMRNKAPGEDNITGGILQGGGEDVILTDLFNKCLHHLNVPKAWKNVLIVLICKREKYIRHQKLQTNQLASHYIQGVFKHPSTKN